MDRVIAWDKTKIEGVAVLPASKSISNRALVLCALAGCPVPENLSDSDDTRVLREALSTSGRLVNVGHAGTAMRFLTAYFALKGGVRELTGSERMKQRPVQVLVDALRELGASITYMGDEGFPPLWITSAPLQGGRSLSLDASVSSQYVSALMMIAPLLPGGLTLDLEERIVSAAYIRMTAGMMRLFGVDVRFEGKKIIIPEKGYIPVNLRVESDWTAASYFYEMLSIVGQGEIFISDLEKDSLQGDALQYRLWEQLGVQTEWRESGVLLRVAGENTGLFKADFTEMPDLALTFIVTCCLKDIPFHICGLETLYVKECDRVTASIRELHKLGYDLDVPVHGELSWNRERNTLISLEIDTYQDHRMAMAFAPVGLKLPGLVIRNAGVVTKSFPTFRVVFNCCSRFYTGTN